MNTLFLIGKIIWGTEFFFIFMSCISYSSRLKQKRHEMFNFMWDWSKTDLSITFWSKLWGKLFHKILVFEMHLFIKEILYGKNFPRHICIGLKLHQCALPHYVGMGVLYYESSTTSICEPVPSSIQCGFSTFVWLLVISPWTDRQFTVHLALLVY